LFSRCRDEIQRLTKVRNLSRKEEKDHLVVIFKTRDIHESLFVRQASRTLLFHGKIIKLVEEWKSFKKRRKKRVLMIPSKNCDFYLGSYGVW